MARDTWFETVSIAQERAKKRLPKSAYSALLAGSEKGLTYSDNVQAFGELGFAPHVIGATEKRDLATTVMGQDISMPVLIGIMMLFGIVAKNSILLVDFAIEEMDHGVGKMEALLDAGRKRAQPIVMTTVAMIAGMVPTALALSGDGSFRAPMGITVIGGLLLSTLLTLLIVPGWFSLALNIERWIGPRLGRRLLTYRPGDENGPAIEHQGTEALPASGPRSIGHRGAGEGPQPAE